MTSAAGSHVSAQWIHHSCLAAIEPRLVLEVPNGCFPPGVAREMGATLNYWLDDRDPTGFAYRLWRSGACDHLPTTAKRFFDEARAFQQYAVAQYCNRRTLSHFAVSG